VSQALSLTEPEPSSSPLFVTELETSSKFLPIEYDESQLLSPAEHDLSPRGIEEMHMRTHH
jgi:hypothetical protein